MATASVERVHHGTLSGTSVDTVTITGPHDWLEVFNRAAAGGADIWVTTDGSTPAANGENNDIVPAATSLLIPASAGDGGTVVKLVGNGNPYSITETKP